MQQGYDSRIRGMPTRGLGLRVKKLTLRDISAIRYFPVFFFRAVIV
jgi:hypothetical protein